MTVNARLVVTRNDFAKIAAGLTPEVTKVVVATAYAVEAEAKVAAPVKTGNLRRSIHTVPLDASHAQVGTDVEYAPHQEYGTRNMPAHPFLTPAVEHARAPFLAALARVFR